VLSVGARAASFGNPDEPAAGAINANPGAVRDPGPQNAALASQFPDAQSPPAADIGKDLCINRSRDPRDPPF
jgi:oxalate decarboxylase